MVDSNKLKQLNGYEARLKAAQNLYDTREWFRVRSDYYDAYINTNVNEKMIMYEAFSGRGITCNPGQIFRYLLDDPRFEGYTHVWSLEESEFRDTAIEMYADYDNIVFTKPYSNEYFYYISTAKYLINNVTWPNYFTPKDSQVVINTWHGIPLKYLGFDVPDGKAGTANMIRNLLFTDYVISPAEYMTDIYRNSFKLEGIYPGKVIEAGHPRIDCMFDADKYEIQKVLTRCGVKYDVNKKLILYAPTWRGEKYGISYIDLDIVDEYEAFIKKISQFVDMAEYQILVKPHQIVYEALVQKGLMQDNFIPAVVDTNKLLGVTDVLISDYSSIFFDFLVTKRPIFFYITDLEAYSESRGLYFTVDYLPGPVTDNLDQLGEWIRDLEHYKEFFTYSRYEEAINKFAYLEDGKVCERVVDAVFFGDETYTKELKNNKIKLLVHIGGIRFNGISTAALNFMEKLDKEKYDVSFYAVQAQGFGDCYCEYLKSLDDDVRVIARIGARINNIETYARIESCIDNAITIESGSNLFPKEFYEIEYRRCFGNAKFDYIIEFSGFSAFFANIYASQLKTKKLIWMHNTMEKEYNRLNNKGSYALRRDLDNIYQLYSLFDGCVSCSHAVMKENARYFDRLGIKCKHLYVRNFFNKEKVLLGLENYGGLRTSQGDFFISAYKKELREGLLVRWPSNYKKTFVTVGRLAEAKNTEALVRAFAMLHNEYADTELYLIGAGPDEKRLRQVITAYKLEDCVVMTGNLDNPFPIMEKCDCFVMPSHYEGQPIVILEARILHLPIIVSNFATVEDSCCERGQLVIGMEVEDIYEGMKKFMLGQVPCDYDLDIDEYNRKAMEEFEYCLAACDRREHDN
ncbi:glycosyltransferase [Selenomonas sp. AB3002]|uniref:CDP-glycerol glycerophosphotransferase family protein n=1 Tax=Selenomonas sp. AB3002 TaxID=1392502 RepID=UPI000495C278